MPKFLLLLLAVMAQIHSADAKYISPDPPFKDVQSMIGLSLSDMGFRRHLDGYNFVKPTEYDVKDERDITILNNFNHTVTYRIRNGVVVGVTLWIQDTGWQYLHYNETVEGIKGRATTLKDVIQSKPQAKAATDEQGWTSLTEQVGSLLISYNFDEHSIIYSVTCDLTGPPKK